MPPCATAHPSTGSAEPTGRKPLPRLWSHIHYIHRRLGCWTCSSMAQAETSAKTQLGFSRRRPDFAGFRGTPWVSTVEPQMSRKTAGGARGPQAHSPTAHKPQATIRLHTSIATKHGPPAPAPTTTRKRKSNGREIDSCRVRLVPRQVSPHGQQPCADREE